MSECLQAYIGLGYMCLLGLPIPRGGRANKNFNALTQIAQPKFLIGKAQIAEVKNKIGKAQAQIAQEKIKSVKRKRNLFQKFNKAQNAQTLKKNW